MVKKEQCMLSRQRTELGGERERRGEGVQISEVESMKGVVTEVRS